MLEAAANPWRRIRGAERILDLRHGVVFKEGIPVTDDPPEHQVLAA